MKQIVSIILFTFCILVASSAGQLPSKSESPYPNELPNLRIYQEAKWNALRPFVSTEDDIRKLLGKAVAVYDEALHTYVPGYQDDPEWTIVISVVDKGGSLSDSVAGRVYDITLYPKKRISLLGADFSAFRGDTVIDQQGNEESTAYHDEFGLLYVVWAKDTADGRFHAGDLKEIIYGPSREDIEKYEKKRQAKP